MLPWIAQPTADLGTRSLRGAVWTLDVLMSVLLNLILAKPISIFVWWLHAGANHTTFKDRRELARRVRRARRAGEPVLFASNHLSMFDDPVVPMALFRTGARAAAELLGLAALLTLWRATPPRIVPPEVLTASVILYTLGIALFGARKTWWSLGDLVNFSGASALRGKLESGRDEPLSVPARVLLAIADPAVFFFMRSATVKTVLVDRRPDQEGRRSRHRAVERTIELAARAERIWIFFEGGRSRNPDQIRPARAGIGQVVMGLQARGIRPVVIAVHQRGLERVIPIASRRWLTTGHRIEISWSEFDLGGDHADSDAAQDPQKIADDIRDAVVRLQSEWRMERQSGA